MLPLLLTRVAKRQVAFFAQDVQEVLLCPALEASPNFLELCDGCFRLGRQWVSVVSMASLMTGETQSLQVTDLLLLSRDERAWALRISAVDGLRNIKWEDVHAPDSSVNAGPGLTGQLEGEMGPIPIYVLPQVLMKQEQEVLQLASSHLEEREKKASDLLKRSSP